MNSLERIRAAVAFRETDRTPVIPQIFAHAAVLTGTSFRDYMSDGAVLARCQIAALKHYAGDAVFGFMDAGIETEAMGSELRFHDQQYPDVARYALAPDTALEQITLPDLSRAGRIPELLRAITALRVAVGDAVPVIGTVLGPMTLATQFMGIEATLELAIDEPQRFEALLDLATRFALHFGVAQLAAGAHLAMVFDPSASSTVVPPSLFRELLVPRLGELARAFKNAGALANWLHIAGPVESILAAYPQAGAEIANLDYEVDPGRAIQLLPRTCLDGNIKPLLFVDGTPAQVADEARRLVALFARRGGFILSSGCEIPPEAKPENIAAMVAVALERG